MLPAYADELQSIAVDKTHYTLKEYFTVTGQIEDYDSGRAEEVLIDVLDAEGQALTGGSTEYQDPCCLYALQEQTVAPETDGTFSYTFYISGDAQAVQAGRYTVRATYAGKSVETGFDLALIHTSAANGQGVLTVAADKASYTVREYVGVTGRVNGYDSASGRTVRIDVFDAEGRVLTGSGGEGQDPCCLYVISGRNVTPGPNGSYTDRFFIPADAAGFSLGQFTVQATFGGASVEAQFEVTDAHTSAASGQDALTVASDKVSYTLQEYVGVSGRVADYDPASGETVRIDAFDSEGRVMTGSGGEGQDPCCLSLISGRYVTPQADGSYTDRFFIPADAPGFTLGQLTLQASYAGASVETMVEVTATHQSTAPGAGDLISVETDKPTYLLPDVVRDVLRDVFESGYVNITGQIANYDPAAGNTVRIDVFDPEGHVQASGSHHQDSCCLHMISGIQVTPEQDGSYAFRLWIPIRAYLPDRVHEFKQGQYTVQVSYGGQSAETSFRIADTPGPISGDAEIQQPYLVTNTFAPPRMVPGRTFNHIIEVANEGTVAGHFLVQVAFGEIIEFDQDGIFYFVGSEIVHSDQNFVVFSVALEPQQKEIISVPIKVRPELVQFEAGELQAGKLIVVGDSFPPTATFDIATLSPEAWGSLAAQSEGADLVNLAEAASIERLESFHAQLDSLEATNCQLIGAASQGCVDAVLADTRDAAPGLASMVESLILEGPTDVDADIRVPAGTAGPDDTAGLEPAASSNSDNWTGIAALIYPQQQPTAQAPAQESPAAEGPHVCPICKKEPSKLTMSDHGIKMLEGFEGYAGQLDKCNTKEKGCSIDGKSTTNYGFYNDISGYCTTGIGHLVAKKSCQAIDKEAADSADRKAKDALAWIKTKDDGYKQKKADLPTYEKAVRDNVKVPLCQAQFDALVSFTFNVGEPNFKSSTLLKKVNKEDFDGAAKEFAKWNKSAGKVVKGLTDRRADEANMFKNCEPGPCTDLRSSMDPNHLYATPEGFMRSGNTIFFTAMFENLPTATAPAFDVRVVVPIDQDLDIDTLANVGTSHPGTLSEFTVDRDTREATWLFTNIELPPNTAPPQGEGWVRFTARPMAGLATGAEIKSQARIFFDFNPPIETNVVEHRIDDESPSSTVRPLSTATTSSSFDVEWDGSDQGSGVAHVSLIVTQDGGIAYQVLPVTQGNSVRFAGEPGHTYSFVSVAVDGAGNVEANSGPDTSITINEPKSQWWLFVLIGAIAVAGISTGSWWFLMRRKRGAATLKPPATPTAAPGQQTPGD